MKKYIAGLIILLVLGCNTKTEEKESVKNVQEEPISELSIYNLPSKWTNQDGKNIELKELKGDVLVMVMIYTSCKAACPRLVADMRHIEENLTEKTKEKVKFILVSIDPEVDTPERLKNFSIENKIGRETMGFPAFYRREYQRVCSGFGGKLQKNISDRFLSFQYHKCF